MALGLDMPIKKGIIEAIEKLSTNPLIIITKLKRIIVFSFLDKYKLIINPLIF